MSEFEDFLLGKDAGLFFGDKDSTSVGSLVLVDNVRDLTIDMQAKEADVSSRASGGWEATAQTLRSCTINFQMVHKPGDPAFDAIQNAFLTSGQLSFAALDRKEGGQGPLGNFTVNQFSRNESLTEAIMDDVTLKLSKFVEWVK